MNSIVKYAYIITSIIFVVYLTIPTMSFPNKITDSLQSNEPADTENPQRKAYFTNLTRNEVIDYYIKQMKNYSKHAYILPLLRLNYPPEESKTIIRDQTRSTYLEELVFPLRESIYINGFEPTDSKDEINIGGRLWKQKIIIRHVECYVINRLITGLLIILIIPVICKYTYKIFIDFYKSIQRFKLKI